MTEEIYLGVTDLPCEDDSKDDLEIGKYVDGLEQFIRKCPTPMSIAIQGDWGTGKTSMINMLRRRLENEVHSDTLPCVYFNTWQYSQFNMADDLYLSFVDTLLSKCCDTYKKKELFKTIAVMAKKYAVHTVEERTGLDIDSLLESEQKRVDSVSGLKDSFQKVIDEKTKAEGRNRMIIFIDDLDRLNPEVAVELLEVIKLFMDVPKCVFILAIDYDVVVSGVRKKYGNDISEEKCRSFFDKIIQLPFTMPVNTYSLRKMVDHIVGERIKADYISIVTELVDEMLNSNPRAFKRLANSYYMTDIVSGKVHDRKANDGGLESALILGSLCIQISVPELYNFLAENAEDLESTLSLQGEELQQAIEKGHATRWDESSWKIEKGMLAMKKMIDSLGNGNKEIYRLLSQTLSMSAVTNIVSTRSTRSAAMVTTKIRVNGEEKNVVNPTDALKTSFELLLKNEPELAKDFMKKENNILTTDGNMSESVFRAKKELEGIGIELYLGTSTGSQVKRKQLEKLCAFLKENGKPADVQWMDGDKVI